MQAGGLPRAARLRCAGGDRRRAALRRGRGVRRLHRRHPVRRVVGDGHDRAPAGGASPRLHLRGGGDVRTRTDPAGDARRSQRVLRWNAGRRRRGPFEESFQGAMRRTAARRDAATAGARQPCVTHVFLGAKGGAGTTTVAVNSAIEIARLSKRPTVIIDLNQCLGEVALFLGVRPRFTRDRRDRQPAPPGPGVHARADRRTTSRASTFWPAAISSTGRTPTTPARSKSCCSVLGQALRLHHHRRRQRDQRLSPSRRCSPPTRSSSWPTRTSPSMRNAQRLVDRFGSSAPAASASRCC